MERRRAFEDDDVSWRDRLARWPAAEPPARLEHRLRRTFRERQRTATLVSWASAAALVVLTVSVAIAVRWAGGGRSPVVRPERSEAVTFVISADEVGTELDLGGFEPVRRARVVRLEEAATEASLEGFEPMKTIRITKLSKGGRQ